MQINTKKKEKWTVKYAKKETEEIIFNISKRKLNGKITIALTTESENRKLTHSYNGSLVKGLCSHGSSGKKDKEKFSVRSNINKTLNENDMETLGYWQIVTRLLLYLSGSQASLITDNAAQCVKWKAALVC